MRWPAALLAAAAALVLASPADAARLGGKKWPTRTITYHVGDAAVRGARSRTATRAWNRSGVRIRFKRVASKRRAALHIVYGHGGGPSGRASLGYRSRSTSSRQTIVNGRRYRGPVGCVRAARAQRAGSCGSVRCLYGAHVCLDHVQREEARRPLPAQLHDRRRHARARPRARPAPPEEHRARS